MSYVLFNNEIEKASKTGVSYSDRGFQYGDGLFETMISQNGTIRFLDDHIDRIKRGLKELQINFPSEFQDSDYIYEAFKSLKKKNEIEGDCRIKLMIWRKEGGLYTPNNSNYYTLLSIQPFVKADSKKTLTVDYGESIKVPLTPVSFCKSLSSMTYTFAGIEKKTRELDDLILINYDGYLAETISGNLFWIKDKVIYTPKVAVGCVSGIARKNIIAHLEQKGYKVRKVFARKAELMEADTVMTTNVTGVTMIKEIGEKQYKVVDAWKKVFEQAYD